MRSLPLISLAVCLCWPAAVQAQLSLAIANPDDDEPPLVQGNEILVLAPRIRGQLDVPQQPIEVLDEADIASYGANSIAELLAAIAPQTGSGRGRGGGRPVMLVNGQRVTSFREMRNIPPEAIRRLEVLPEEVALRFGYPANQRVVNIILKEQFASATGAGEYNAPTRGGYDNFELEGGLFKVAGPRRFNFSAKLDQTSMLTEAERDLRQAASSLPSVPGDPDPALYRSLAPASREITLEGTMTQGLGENGLSGSITASGGYTHSRSRALSGLDSVVLQYGGVSALRTLPDPLASRAVTDAWEAGFGFSRFVGNWQLSTTMDASYSDTETRVDRRRDTSVLVAQAAAGLLPIDGPLPPLPGLGADTARNRALAMTSLATLSGEPFRMPAGPVSLTAKAGYNFNRTHSDDTRTMLGAVKLRRGDLQMGGNLALPLLGEDFVGAIGEVSLNFSAGLNHLSDFGTLTDWSAGVNWSPTGKLNLQASYLVTQAAPGLSQLGAPTIVSYNVPVYDFANATTALVTVTSGGNPDILREKQRDIKISATWDLPVLNRSKLVVEYFRNRSSDVTQSFPLLTPAIEAAFPARVMRDASGALVAVDRRPVTFDQIASSRLRWGVNLSGSLGGTGVNGGMPAGRFTPPVAAARAAGGAAGPMPGNVGGGGFDPARFDAMRARLCTSSPGEPDLSDLPAGLRARLAGPDGKPDPQRLAQFRERICSRSAEGAAGGFDPARLEAMRKALCADGTPDLSVIPERMADRLRGPDGQVDAARLAEMRERVCRAEAPPYPVQPVMRAAAGAGGPPPMMGGRRGPGSRWNIAVYHTWRFTDRANIAPGVPPLDQLAGDAISSGGVPRHAIEAEGGMFKNGFGLRLQAQWQAPARVNGSGLPGSSDLRFGSTTDISVRLFADLGSKPALVERIPFLKGARLALTADNLLDNRQRVTDGNGEVPIAYQAAFRQPQGRVLGIDFRKMF